MASFSRLIASTRFWRHIGDLELSSHEALAIIGKEEDGDPLEGEHRPKLSDEELEDLIEVEGGVHLSNDAMELLELSKRFAKLVGSLVNESLEVAMSMISHVVHLENDYIYPVDTYTKSSG